MIPVAEIGGLTDFVSAVGDVTTNLSNWNHKKTLLI